MLKLKLQYFGHLMGITDLLEKTLMLGKIGGGRKRRRQKMRWLGGLTDTRVTQERMYWGGEMKSSVFRRVTFGMFLRDLANTLGNSLDKLGH